VKLSKRVVLSLLVLTAFVLPMTVAAQDEELPEGFVAWTSEDENYQLAHPEGFFAGIAEFDGSITVANSEDLYNRLIDEDVENDPLESGDQAIAIVLLPTELFALMGVELDPTLPADEFAAALVTVMMEGDTSEDVPTFGEASIVELGEDVTAGAVSINIPDQNIEGLFIVREVDGIVVLGVLASFTGEAADFEEVGTQIFASFQTSVTVEDLMGEMMGEPAPEATEESN
jgi:hypothetical protein